jgi:hypothetical protein
VQSWCRACVLSTQKAYYRRNSQRIGSYVKLWKATNADRVKKLARFKLYGLSPAAYLELVASQDERCAICRKKPDKILAVDHDHVTGKVRGLLCQCCNLALGQAKDSPSILRAAAHYLESHAAANTNRDVDATVSLPALAAE